MLYFSVVQNQEILLALGAGAVVTLIIVLAYLEMWRPRDSDSDERTECPSEPPHESAIIWFLSFVPWIVMLVIAGAGIWGFLYTIDKILHPPNW
jgi:hypothetical protein